MRLIRNRPRLLASTAALAAIAALAIPALAATRSVKVGDNYYVRDGSVPPRITINRGDTVVWRFLGRSPHTVTAVRGGPQTISSPARTTGVYKRRLTRRYTYTIYCRIHGRRDQSMRLIVK
jgi:plastocyanin